jgi:hypothetical protein
MLRNAEREKYGKKRINIDKMLQKAELSETRSNVENNCLFVNPATYPFPYKRIDRR